MNYVWKHIFENFVLGGTMIALVSYLASFENTVLASLLWACPLFIFPSMYFMKQHHHSNQSIAKFLFSTTFALGLLLLCTLSISYVLHHSKPSAGITPVILVSSLAWGICAFVFYWIVENSGYRNYFMYKM